MAFADSLELENASALKRQDLMFAILKKLAENEVEIQGEGVLEVLQDGFGFLRSPEANYMAGSDDIYVSPSQIRKHSLKTGDTLEGTIRPPKEGERYFAMSKISTVNGDTLEAVRHRVNFDDLTPLYPDSKIDLEFQNGNGKDLTTRVIELISPLGRGQRALIVAPPRTGKTVMLQNLAHAIKANSPET